MTKRVLMTAAIACAPFFASPATAVTFFTSASNQGQKPPAGFEKLYYFNDFDANTPPGLTGGSVVQGSVTGVNAAPYGDTTNYYSVGPSAGNPATVLISGGFDKVSLYWGSIDSYNTLSFLGAGGSVLQSFTGTQILGFTPTQLESRTVTFGLSAAESAVVTGIRFSSTTNAFEFDNLAIGSAPEPATWATLMLGFGVAGGALRRRTRTRATLKLA